MARKQAATKQPTPGAPGAQLAEILRRFGPWDAFAPELVERLVDTGLGAMILHSRLDDLCGELRAALTGHAEATVALPTALVDRILEAFGDSQNLAMEKVDDEERIQKLEYALDKAGARRDPWNKGQQYDRIRVTQAYKALTMGYDADGGIDWSTKTWEQCGLNPPPGPRKFPSGTLPPATADDVITLPLSKKDAITAIAAVFKYSSENACWQALYRYGVRGLPGRWPVT